jgi:hypothetical protein
MVLEMGTVGLGFIEDTSGMGEGLIWRNSVLDGLP